MSRLADGAKMLKRPLVQPCSSRSYGYPQALRPKIGCPSLIRTSCITGNRRNLVLRLCSAFSLMPSFEFVPCASVIFALRVSLPSSFLCVPAFSLWTKHDHCKLTALGLKKTEIPDSSRMESMTFGYAPCDPLPFYQESNFWNRHGHGALFDISAASRS